MPRNSDNWVRLVEAVVKREQIWQLCHQDSISTVSSSDYSSHFDLSFSQAPLSPGSSTHAFRMSDTFKSVLLLGNGFLGTTVLALLLHDVQVSDNFYLELGTKAVIKSLNTKKITEDEFEQQMTVLGNCRHENVGTPWAYYFTETTKFIVYDYYSAGSVFDMLCGNKSRPNWESRMRIAIGAARGIAHIHEQCEGKLAHGNIKFSNIFVNPQCYGFVSDFGMWVDGYKRPSQEGDVYSFGELLLKLVARDSTGASLIARHIYDGDMAFAPRFVVELDRLLSESLYSEVMGSVVQQEVRRMLQVARRCLSLIPEERPRMRQVVLELEQIAQPSTQRYRNPRGDNNKKEALWHKFLHFRR